MEARRVPGLSRQLCAEPPSYEPGQFDVEADARGQRWLWLACPGSCRQLTPLALEPVIEAFGYLKAERRTWTLSGPEDAPTLHPSINHRGCWHGWLRAGRFDPA